MNRRDLMRGLVGGSAVMVALPWLESTARAEGGFPKRFVNFIWGNGNRPERWTPSSEGMDFSLSDELAPLAAFRAKLSVPTGLSVLYPNNVPHWSGIGGLLTGAVVDGDDADWIVNAPSLDQVIANEIGGSNIYRSLQVGVSTSNVFSWNGPNAQNPGDTDPFVLYQRLFGDTFIEPGSGGLVDPSLGHRRSALDAVLGDLDRLKQRVSATDRIRLDQHLTGIRELEGRLTRLQEDPPDYAACVRPDEPVTDFPDVDGRPQLQARHEAHARLIAMALACDLTRVVTVQWSEPVDNVLYPGASDGHHNQTHNEPGAQPEVHAITTQIMDGFGVLLDALDTIPEAEGTLLDHSLVMGCTDVSEGRTHSLDEMPVVFAGSCCGAIRTGHHTRYVRKNANSLGLTVLRAMDVPRTSWGTGDYVADTGLSEFEA